MKSSATLYFLFMFVALLSGKALGQVDQLAPERAYKIIDESTIGTRDGDLGVPNGHVVSDVSISDTDGNLVALDELWKDQALMVVFYRGGWCPYCNMQIRELSEDYAAFEKEGVLPVLISVDQPDVTSLTTETYDIPFPVLSDQDLVAHTEFNVINKLSQEHLDWAASRGRDFADWSGRDHQTIAVASSFLVDTNGVVQWSTVLEDYTSRPTVKQLMAAISNWKATQ